MGAVVAAYSCLLSFQRAPAPVAGAPVAPPGLSPLALPTRLPRAELAGTIPAPAAAPSTAVQTRELRCTVAGLPEDLRARIGLGTFASTTGAGFAWTPLAGGTVAGDGAVTVVATVPAQWDLEITVAEQPEFARFAYLARSVVAASDLRRAAPIDVRLSVAVATVTFALTEPPLDRASLGPWRLTRTDDPRWLPMQLPSTGMFLSGDGSTTLVLGGGRYELRDPVDPRRAVAFRVPDDTRVPISSELTTARAAHR